MSRSLTIDRILTAFTLMAALACIFMLWSPLPAPPSGDTGQGQEKAARQSSQYPIQATPKDQEIMLARPLFDPSRKALSLNINPQTDIPRLVGLWGDNRATFELATGRSVIARAGDRVAGWVVKEVRADAAILTREGQIRTVKLLPGR